MTNITIYDQDAKRLEEISSQNDVAVFELVEMLMEYVDEMKENNFLD